MALNIPNTDLPGNSFLKGIDTGSTLFTRLMQPIIEREKQKQQAEQFAQELALKKQAAARMGANSGLTRQILEQNLLKLKHSNDPQWALQQLQSKLDAIQNLGNQGGGAPGLQGQGGQQQPSVNLMDMIGQGQEQDQQMPQGQGPMMPQEEQAPQMQPSDQPQGQDGQLPSGLDLEQIKRALTYQALGLKAPSGSGTFEGAARHAVDLERLRKQFGENSDVYKNAKREYDSIINAKNDLSDIRQRTKQGLKPGEKEFFDPNTGEALGKEVNLSAKEKESEEGNILFNELYPLVYKGGYPFSGEGSITRLEQAVKNYKNNPQARKLVDDYLLADKALGAATVNEASTLKAGKTNRTYALLKDTLNAQDIPKLAKKFFKEYNLPASAQLKASMRYQEALSNARKKARTSVPATQKLYYNPEMQAQHEADKLEGNTDQKTSENQKVVVIDPTGKKFHTTEENAAHLPTGWKRG